METESTYGLFHIPSDNDRWQKTCTMEIRCYKLCSMRKFTCVCKILHNIIHVQILHTGLTKCKSKFAFSHICTCMYLAISHHVNPKYILAFDGNLALMLVAASTFIILQHLDTAKNVSF